MKITTRAVYQWNPSTEEYDLVEEQSFDYDGPVAEAKGGSVPDTTTQTTQTKPFDEQLPYVRDVFSQAKQIYNQGPTTYYPGQTVAGFAPETEAGFQYTTDLANNLGGFLAPQQSAFADLLRTPDPANDPTVAAFADAATAPIQREFYQKTLPSIGSAATGAGAFGGSRQAIIEGQAANDFASRMGETRAGIYNNAYGQQLDAQQRALALAPQLLQQMQMPGQLLGQVGTARENLAQQQMNDAAERYFFNQNADLANLQSYSNLINQFGGSSSMSTTTGTAPRQNPLMGALGGASTGLGLASALALPGPGWAYALGGGLMGLL